MNDDKELESKKLSDDQLEEAAGGYMWGMPPYPYPTPAPQYVEYKPRPYISSYTCNECAVRGHMNTPLYSVPSSDVMFCLEAGHIYRGLSYDHCNLDEAKAFFN